MKQRRAVQKTMLKGLSREMWSQTSLSVLAEEVPDWRLQKGPFLLIEGAAYSGGKGWALQWFAASAIRFVAAVGVVEGNLLADPVAGGRVFAVAAV
jgi:hypothetical protein